jgi:PIN domain nuclease of toxin-antitoxin system
MRLLLDTHALLWWVTGDERLEPLVRAHIADETNEVFVSAASVWEIAIKARLGKLTAGPFAYGAATEIERQGFAPLSITTEHAERAGSLPTIHADPFDRMLIAQSQAVNLLLVSNERIFDRYGVSRVW